MARAAASPARQSRITVPVHAHPMARVVFAEMARQGVTYDQLEWDAGVLKSTFKAWRTDKRPGLDTIEAALGALGWQVLPVPRLDKLPAEIQRGLEALAERYGELDPLICQLIAAVSKVPLTVRRGEALPPKVRARRGRPVNPFQATMFGEIVH